MFSNIEIIVILLILAMVLHVILIEIPLFNVMCTTIACISGSLPLVFFVLFGQSFNLDKQIKKY